MIEDRSPLKHSVHKVCVPNQHIAHFRKAQDGAGLNIILNLGGPDARHETLAVSDDAGAIELAAPVTRL